MLDTILSPPPPQQPLPSNPPLLSLSRRQKQPSPPSSQDTLAAFIPHMTERGYQPDTDDIGSNDDINSDSHDDLFSASGLSALMVEQDLQRQQAAKKLQSHQLKQRQLLIQQHQRIFQDSQQMHSSSTSDRSLPSTTSSSHMPGNDYNSNNNNNRADEEEQDDDEEDDEDDDEDDESTQATPRRLVNTPKREQQQHQYDSNLAQYQESDDDNAANTPAPLNSDKKPKARGRPKGATAVDTTPSKTASSNSRNLDKPKRQYKKTILRQQAALLAAQIKDENDARNTEATRRVLAQTCVIKVPSNSNRPRPGAFCSIYHAADPPHSPYLFFHFGICFLRVFHNHSTFVPSSIASTLPSTKLTKDFRSSHYIWWWNYLRIALKMIITVTTNAPITIPATTCPATPIHRRLFFQLQNLNAALPDRVQWWGGQNYRSQ
jgi:hypothetical protein